MPSKNRRKRKGMKKRPFLSPQKRHEAPDPARGPRDRPTPSVISEQDSVQPTDARPPSKPLEVPSTTNSGTGTGESAQNAQPIHPPTAPSTIAAGPDVSESAQNNPYTNSLAAPSTTGTGPNTGNSTQNATPTESPDTSETTQDAAPTPSPTTRGPTAEIPTSSNDDGAYLSDLIEQLSTAQGSGEHLGLQAWGYTPLDSSALYRELMDSNYEEWIDGGGPRKPTPKVGPIRKMYLCVNWINKDRPEIELSHELVYLCLKEYTRRNSMFHSELGADGVEGNEEKIEGVFDRDMKRVEQLIGTHDAHRLEEVGKYHEGRAEGQSKLLPTPKEIQVRPTSTCGFSKDLQVELTGICASSPEVE
ncbi:hypothetical protein BJX65DRAFT_313900 [Aspergillus insuetus]